jgi:hypothetical protein
VLVPIGFLATAALFLVGTAVIVTDKGQPLLVGLALGIIAPLGTMIALLLGDKNHAESDGPVEANASSVRSAATEEAETGTFGTSRKMIMGIALFAAIAYALCHFGIYAGYMLKFNGGVPAAKVFIAGIQGLMSGIAVWGAAVMFTVTVAPRQWLLNSGPGKQWMARTGLKTQSSTVPLRVMTAVIGSVAAAWVVLSVTVLLKALTSQE